MDSSEFTNIMAKGYNKEKLEIKFHQNLLQSTDWKEHVRDQSSVLFIAS